MTYRLAVISVTFSDLRIHAALAAGLFRMRSFVHLCRAVVQDFIRHKASGGPSATAKLLVKCCITNCVALGLWAYSYAFNVPHTCIVNRMGSE